MAETKEENKQMYEESFATKSMEKSEQMHGKSSSEKIVPKWLSSKGKINIKAFDYVNLVLRRIQERLAKYSSTLMECETPIYINTVSADDDKPILLSIGPIHHDTINPDKMEVHKLKLLRKYVERFHTDVEKLVRASFLELLVKVPVPGRIFDPKEQILAQAAGMEMSILDGCFVIEFFLRARKPFEFHGNAPHRDVSDFPIFKPGRVLNALTQDLIRHDNQLSLKILEILWKGARLSGQSDVENHHGDFEDFLKSAYDFLKQIVPNQKPDWPSSHSDDTNLLSMVYDSLNWPRVSKEHCNYNDFNDEWNMANSATELEQFGVKIRMREADNFEWNMAKSATELEQFGVKIRMREADNFADLKFTKKGVLEIPCIRIRCGTTYCIKALLKYEQSQRLDGPLYINDYLLFMNGLVKSSGDVQLLRQKGIIDNLSELSNDVDILKFLNDLYASLQISVNYFYYIQVCKDLNSHCKRPFNVWMAKLRRDYFNSPWAYISFAAFLLLILIIVQTVFSVLSYYN